MTDKDGLPKMPLRLSRRHVLSGMATGLLDGRSRRQRIRAGAQRIIVPEGEFTRFRSRSEFSSRARLAMPRSASAWRRSSPTTSSASGLFAPIDQAAFIERITNIDTAPQFQSWKSINAQALVTGRMTRQGDGG